MISRFSIAFFILALGIAAGVSFARAQSPGPESVKPAHPLVWDAMEKTLVAKLGEEVLPFQFSVTNTSAKTVTIDQIRPTCGCTVAEMPSTPWVLEPGASGMFVGTIDVRGKEGTLSKLLLVNSSAGTQPLGINVKMPTLDEDARKRNQMLAQTDRQAVFRGECAICHVKPTLGRMGGELFTAACGVCHLSTHRASMVPDIMVANQPRDAAYWRKWITTGKDGTLMPAWSTRHGGPLSDEQIESLVEFALAALPTTANTNAGVSEPTTHPAIAGTPPR